MGSGDPARVGPRWLVNAEQTMVSRGVLWRARRIAGGGGAMVTPEDLRQATGLLLDTDVPDWNEASVPIERRGVKRSWLTQFVDDVQAYINRDVQAPPEFFKSSKYTPATKTTPLVDAGTYRSMPLPSFCEAQFPSCQELLPMRCI